MNAAPSAFAALPKGHHGHHHRHGGTGTSASPAPTTTPAASADGDTVAGARPGAVLNASA